MNIIDNIELLTDLRTDTQLRQSMDRFDDELVEKILSYLAFNEKVLFESVSKQWKRLIYNRQKALLLTPLEIGSEEEGWDLTDMPNQILETVEVIDYSSSIAFINGLKQINKLWLKSVLKKCKSIERIVLDCYVDVEALEIVCKECPRLKNIEFESIGLCADDLDYIGKRYGHMFETVLFGAWISNFHNFPEMFLNKLLIHCKNLRNLAAPHLSKLFLEDEQYLPKLQVTNDYQVHLEEDKDRNENLRRFQMFCQFFSQSLTALSVSLFGRMREKYIELFFNSINKLKQLTFLSCILNSEIEAQNFLCRCIGNLSQSQPKLRTLYLTINSSKPLNPEKVFNSLNGSTNLVTLALYVYGYGAYVPLTGSLQGLKSSKNLKSLEIFYKRLNENYFKDIDKYLPNLSLLWIKCESEITDKTIFELSHLKKLKRFELNKCKRDSKFITDVSVCALINGCPALKRLIFTSRPNITAKTIESLIRCANTYPKRSLYLSCGLGEQQEVQQIPAIDMNNFANKIPANLTIDYI